MSEPIGDDVPWGALEWTLELVDDAGSVSLTMGQALRVFAAVELGRVASLADVRRALGARDLWAALVAGATGLRVGDAPREMTIREVFGRLGVTGARWNFGQTKAQREASAKAAVERLRAEVTR